MVKLALVLPAGTVTLAGTDATPGMPLDRVTSVPPAGAGALRTTVPVDWFPAMTDAGLRSNPGGGGPEVRNPMANAAQLAEPLELAVAL